MPQLRELDISQISFVDRAAVRDPQNQKEPQRFLLWKSESGTTDQEDPMPDEKTADALFGEIEKSEIPVADQVKGALSLLAKNKGTLTDADKETIAKLSKGEEGAESTEINKEDLPAPVRAALEKAEATAADALKRAESAETIAKAESLKVRKSEFIAKAESLPFVHGGETKEQYGERLMKMADALDDESWAAFEKSEIAKNEQLRKSALFQEIGSGAGGVGGDVLAKAEGLAVELTKSETGMTKEQALAQVWEEHPEMYAEYTASRPKAGR